jgi:hypothetical protein
MWARYFRLKYFVKSPGLANLKVRFWSNKLCSPKQRKQVVVRFSVNTNNIALLNACFSALAAASYGLVSLNGIVLAFRINSLVCG